MGFIRGITRCWLVCREGRPTWPAGLRHVVRTPAAGAVCGRCRARPPQPLAEKYEALKGMQIDRMLCVRFTHRFAEQAASTFIEQLLVEKLGVHYLVVGDDFRFGKGREGDFHLLEEAGRRFGFEVISTQSFQLSRQRVSSTLVREALKAGRMAEVELMLGRPYAISGRVAHGDKLGGAPWVFPPRILALKRQVVPVGGVFAVEVICSGKTFPGVANVGVRPTF